MISGSLQKKINTLLFLVAGIGFFVSAVIFGIQEYKDRKNDYLKLMRSQAQIAQSLLSAELLKDDLRFSSIINNLSVNNIKDDLNILEDQLQHLDPFDIYYVINKDGRIISISSAYKALLNFNISHMDHIRDTHKISHVFQSVFSNRSVVALHYPLKNNMELIHERNLQNILPVLDHFHRGRIYDEQIMFITSSQGIAIYHPNKTLVKTRHNIGYDIKYQGEKDPLSLQTYFYEGKKYFAYEEDFETPAGWHIFLQLPATLLVSSISKIIFTQLLLVFIFFVILTFSLQLSLHHFFSRPISKLVSDLRTFNPFEGQQIIPASKTRDTTEFSQIIEAINTLSWNIQTSSDQFKKSQQQFRDVLDSLDSLVYVADMQNFEILFINRFGREIWGEITGKICWQSLQNGFDGPCPFCTNDKLIDAKGNPTGILTWEFQNTISKRWYECRDQAIPWHDGRLVRMEIATDVTDQKNMIDTLARNEAWLQSIFRSAPIGIGLIVDRIFQMTNKKFSEMTGYSEDELLGQNSRMIYSSQEEHDRVGREKYSQLQRHGTGTVETTFKCKDGSLCDVLLSSSPLDQSDLSKGLLFTALDITDRNKTARELQLHKEKLEEKVQERTRELEEKNAELERFNRLFVDRELRMVELKEEIADLKQRPETTREQPTEEEPSA